VSSHLMSFSFSVCPQRDECFSKFATGATTPDAPSTAVDRLVAKGLTNKEIAARLNLSEYTVRNHIYRIMKQVDARSRSQAVQMILSSGYSFSSFEISL